MTRLPRIDAAFRIGAAVVGTLPAVLFAAVVLARFLPFDLPARFTAGVTLAIPLWVAAMCAVFLARSAARAWGVCFAGAIVLGALAYS